MAYPSPISLPAVLLESVRNEIADIARTISYFEPLTMYVRPEDVDDARSRMIDAKNDPGYITLTPFPVNHCWVRDTGPVYVFGAGQDATHYSIKFNFNEWGGKATGISENSMPEWGHVWPPFDTKSLDDNTAFARRVIDSEAPVVQRIDSKIILEGGGLVVDGDGTLLITESCIVDEARNPGWSRCEIEVELKRILGVEKVIWLPGAKNADITDCHVDAIARFVRPGTVIVSHPHPSQEKVWIDVYEDTQQILENETDARGRKFEIGTLDEPDTTPLLKNPSDEICASRVNFHMCNSGIVAPKFADAKQDQESLEVMKQLWPGREVRQVYINAVAIAGGEIHCLTQQVPHANLPLGEVDSTFT